MWFPDVEMKSVMTFKIFHKEAGDDIWLSFFFLYFVAGFGLN